MAVGVNLLVRPTWERGPTHPGPGEIGPPPIFNNVKQSDHGVVTLVQEQREQQVQQVVSAVQAVSPLARSFPDA